MTIPDTIIEKLQLSQTGERIGDGSYRIFRSSCDGFASVIFMECDFVGNPTKYVRWVNHRAKLHGSVTVEFLNDASIEDIKKMME